MKRQRPEDSRSGVAAPDDVDRLLHAAASVTETLSWKNTALQRSLERAAPPLPPAGGAAAACSGALAPLPASLSASASASSSLHGVCGVPSHARLDAALRQTELLRRLDSDAQAAVVRAGGRAQARRARRFARALPTPPAPLRRRHRPRSCARR